MDEAQPRQKQINKRVLKRKRCKRRHRMWYKQKTRLSTGNQRLASVKRGRKLVGNQRLSVPYMTAGQKK